ADMVVSNTSENGRLRVASGNIKPERIRLDWCLFHADVSVSRSCGANTQNDPCVIDAFEWSVLRGRWCKTHLASIIFHADSSFDLIDE
ncbi:MAG: hypothetical protein L7W43_12180, partial [Rubripirellula sp.]|nr:hypothetical protein [Rubripirellula sp.]